MTLPPQDARDDSNASRQLIEAQATIDQLQSQLDQVLGTSDQQAGTIQKQQKLIEKLRHELDLLKRRLFGQRRERFVEDPRQQQLFDVGEAEEAQADEDAAEDETPKPRRRGHGRRRLPDNIRRKIIPCELNEAELPCPCCGKLRVKVSERLSEQLDYQPAVLFVNQHVRFVYVCPDEDCQPNMVTAPKPPQPIEKGLAGPGLLAFVASSKMADHLPLNRQEDIISRFGIHIARSTQCDWMAACATLARPLYALMVRLTLASKVLGTDDTTVPLRNEQLDRTATAYFWAYVGDDDHPYICYDFTTSHSRDGPEKFLGDFEGYLQTDGYAAYLGIARDSDGKIHNVGCWSHVRRYFDRACDAAPTRIVHEALAYIRRLYDIEHQVDERAAEAGWNAQRRAVERLALRQEKSTGIVREFKDWLDTQQAKAVPSGPLAKAINYALNQWDSLQLFLEDSDIPLDNNRTENTLRQQVIGRLNWLFVGSEKGGETAAVLYTLIATCKRLRIDPFAYLRDVFTRLPSATESELPQLLPDRWIEQHPEYRLAHREREASQADQRRRDRRSRRRKLQKAKAK
jgi:transposase